VGKLTFRKNIVLGEPVPMQMQLFTSFLMRRVSQTTQLLLLSASETFPLKGLRMVRSCFIPLFFAKKML
jgi:hypothetical protein